MLLISGGDLKGFENEDLAWMAIATISKIDMWSSCEKKGVFDQWSLFPGSAVSIVGCNIINTRIQ